MADPCPAISEADIARYMERDVDCWQQAGEAQVSKLLPPRGRFRKGFAHAGLSHDCDTSFFHNGTKVSVYPLVARDRGQSHSSPILKRKFDSNNLIVDVSLSESTLAVSTRQALELYRLESPSASPLRSSHGEWDPSGLAIHEQLSEILIAVGHRRGMMKFREGRVTLYRLKHGEARVDTLASVKLPMQDFPRTLMFDSQGERLTCITEIRSSVLVWHTTDMDPFVISRYHHQPVGRVLFYHATTERCS